MKTICKHYNAIFDSLKTLCETLYSIPGCSTGGNLHVLLDDHKFYDDSIMICLKECLLHPEHPSSSIGIIICYEYLKMRIEERSAFDWYRCGDDLSCDMDCGDCKIADVDWW